MPGRLYETLYPTPSPSTDIEIVRRDTHKGSRPAVDCSGRKQGNAGQPLSVAGILKAPGLGSMTRTLRPTTAEV